MRLMTGLSALDLRTDSDTLTRTLSLVKGEHRFIFKYEDGEEEAVVSSFLDLAVDKKSTFDWYDAVLMSSQLGRRLQEQCKEYRAQCGQDCSGCPNGDVF